MQTPELKRVEDPRHILEKYSRKELEYLARFEGVEELDPAMPVDLMRDIFRRSPPRQWPNPVMATFGAFAGRRRTPPYEQWRNVAFGTVQQQLPEIQEVDALANLKEQWERDKQAPAKDRNEQIYQMSQNGSLHAEIAEKFNISKARVSQIVTRAKRRNGQNAS